TAGLSQNFCNLVVGASAQLLRCYVRARNGVLRVGVGARDDVGGLLFGGAQQLLDSRTQSLVRGLIRFAEVLLRFVESLPGLLSLSTRLLCRTLGFLCSILKPGDVSPDRFAVVSPHGDGKWEV